MKKSLIVAIISLVILSAAAGFIFTVSSKFLLLQVFLSFGPSTPFLEETNILVLGLDNAFGQRSDTIMVLHINPKSKEAALISIPRDTLAVLPNRGLDKINHAYTYGGIDLARKTAENLLKIEIPYYIVANFSGITDLIDELGGITVDVESRMYYVDLAGGLYINLKPGIQKLTGKEALGYLRYRLDGGDLKRISRQQKFLRALTGEMLRRDNLLRSPKLFLTLLSYINTNLDPKKSLGLSLGMRVAYELGQIHMTTLPGTDIVVDGIYYWKPDEAGIKKLTALHSMEDKN
jgi:LCP family protein required for cell wall assembly